MLGEINLPRTYFITGEGASHFTGGWGTSGTICREQSGLVKTGQKY